MSGTVYLLHFETPYEHAQHYLGFSKVLHERLELHRQGRSRVPLIRAVVDAGIKMTLVRTWESKDRHFERKLKNGGHLRRLCPVCNPDSAHRWGTGKTPPHMIKRRRVPIYQRVDEKSAMRRGYRDGRRGADPRPGKLYGAYMRGYRNARSKSEVKA